MLITAPNLLRGGRVHGFLENVVTHPECRGQVMVTRSFRLRLTRPGLATATTCYFKAADRTLVSIGFTRDVALNQKFELITSHAVDLIVVLLLGHRSPAVRNS
jgi:hypothetical protein